MVVRTLTNRWIRENIRCRLHRIESFSSELETDMQTNPAEQGAKPNNVAEPTLLRSTETTTDRGSRSDVDRDSVAFQFLFIINLTSSLFKFAVLIWKIHFLFCFDIIFLVLITRHGCAQKNIRSRLLSSSHVLMNRIATKRMTRLWTLDRHSGSSEQVSDNLQLELVYTSLKHAYWNNLSSSLINNLITTSL